MAGQLCFHVVHGPSPMSVSVVLEQPLRGEHFHPSRACGAQSIPEDRHQEGPCHLGSHSPGVAEGKWHSQWDGWILQHPGVMEQHMGIPEGWQLSSIKYQDAVPALTLRRKCHILVWERWQLPPVCAGWPSFWFYNSPSPSSPQPMPSPLQLCRTPSGGIRRGFAPPKPAGLEPLY